jgi:Tfp pilus assembly protein PilF
MRRWTAIALAAAALLLAGCQTEPFRTIQADFKRAFGGAKGEPALKAGIQQYEEGRYAEASRQLQSAISQGLGTRDEVRAHKTLAFIHCVSDRVAACREEFRKALSLDPGLELSAAEAGHPSWGPVFGSVKAGR